MSEIRQLCSATLSIRPFVVVQCLVVSFKRSATCNISRYSLASIIALLQHPLFSQNSAQPLILQIHFIFYDKGLIHIPPYSFITRDLYIS